MTDRANLIVLGDPASVAVEDIPAAIGELERTKATLWARLTVPQAPNGHAPHRDAPYSLREAAALLLKSPIWLRRRAKVGAVPGAHKYGKAWVFDRAPFDRFCGRQEVS